jgi:hypothetical protein
MKNKKKFLLKKCEAVAYIVLEPDTGEGNDLGSGSVSDKKEIIKYFKNTKNLRIATEYRNDGSRINTYFNRADFNETISDIIEELKTTGSNFSVNRYKISGFVSFFRRV